MGWRGRRQEHVAEFGQVALAHGLVEKLGLRYAHTMVGSWMAEARRSDTVASMNSSGVPGSDASDISMSDTAGSLPAMVELFSERPRVIGRAVGARVDFRHRHLATTA